MADNHYTVDEAKKPARDLLDALRKLREAWDRLRAVRGVLIQRRDGDSSQDSHFSGIALDYGYASDAEARASFLEIDSAFGTGDAAITQTLDRHL